MNQNLRLVVEVAGGATARAEAPRGLPDLAAARDQGVCTVPLEAMSGENPPTMCLTASVAMALVADEARTTALDRRTIAQTLADHPHQEDRALQKKVEATMTRSTLGTLLTRGVHILMKNPCNILCRYTTRKAVHLVTAETHRTDPVLMVANILRGLVPPRDRKSPKTPSSLPHQD